MMLLPGCPCCGTCDACTATCTNPHTGTAFATVYTRYFGGAEAGNPSDGYLTAIGDSDASDPYDGMDGTGPWYQQVGGGFSLGGDFAGNKRFPCSVRVSFWRNNYTLGASTIPAPGSALTENVIEVTVSEGALVAPDGRVITPADGTVAVSSVPLVSGGGDASGSDPRSGDGTVSFSPQCWNVTTTFSIQARVRWNVKKRQHIVYGIVRECYEDTPPGCDNATLANRCTGGSFANTVYLTLSNISVTAISSTSGSGTAPAVSEVSSQLGLFDHTFALSRPVGICHMWNALVVPDGGCPQNSPYTLRPLDWNFQVVSGGGVFASLQITRSGVCEGFLQFAASFVGLVCQGSRYYGTGTDIFYLRDSGFGVYYAGSFDWEVSA